MKFQAQPATHADLDVIAAVVVDAHVDDSVFTKLMPGTPREGLVKWYADAFRKVWDEQRWIQYYKVVEIETGYVRLCLCFFFLPVHHHILFSG